MLFKLKWKKQILTKPIPGHLLKQKKYYVKRKKFIDQKGKIILQTGYGPSGLPHIGTFGEVARTTMLVNALNHLTDLPKEIITFSDDMDGLRKVPDGLPNWLNDYLAHPVSKIPDPFDCHASYGAHMSSILTDGLR